LYKIKIVRVQQELHATNAARFKKAIYELTGLKPQPYIEIKNKIDRYNKKSKMGKQQNKFTSCLTPCFAKLWKSEVIKDKVQIEKVSAIFTIQEGTFFYYK
jgi:hypothetical protein